jgi:DNA-binding winged helix-turn-helix (wHTH) protein
MAAIDLRFGPFRLNPAQRLLARGGVVVPLSPKAFDMLVFLVERRDRVVPKEELLRGLWPDTAVEEANLTQQVFVLRRALMDAEDPEAAYIATVPRRGYRFVAAVKPVERAEAAVGDYTAHLRDRARGSQRSRDRVLTIAITGVTAAVLSTWTLRGRDTAPTVRSDLVLPNDQRLSRTLRGGPALSPDGMVVVWAANRQLYARRLDEPDPQVVTGTSADASSPFFSPDGAWIGFWSAQEASFKKVRIGGGSAVTIAQSSNPRGAGWFGEYIVFAEGGKGIVAVPAKGGPEELWVVPRSDEVLTTPQYLPREDAVVFTAAKVSGNRITRSDVVVYSRITRERKVLIPGARAARYVPDQRILFAAGRQLFVSSFDRRRLQLDGEPAVLARDLDEHQDQFDVSPVGSLVYVPCSCDTRSVERIVELVDVHGTVSSVGLPPAAYTGVQVSPNGMQLAVTRDEDGGTIWIHDITHPSVARRFASEGSTHHPVWSPDGRRVAYAGASDGVNGIFIKGVDGEGTPERLTTAAPGFEQSPGSWSQDGKYLAFVNVKAGIKDTISIFNIDGRRLEEVIAIPGSNQFDPAFSPDGRWIAYASEGDAGNGVLQVYLEPFPRTGAKYRLSRDGGELPVWSRDGSHLFHRVPNVEGVMSMAINLNPFPQVIERVGVSIDGLASDPTYDVSPRRDILVVIDPGSALTRRRSERVALVLNWFRRDPIGRISLANPLR